MLDPQFSSEDISKLDKESSVCRTLDGKQYYAGVVGLNNLGYNDYINVVLQSLSHCSQLRDWFLVPKNYESNQSELVKRFGTLLRRMWSNKNFKNQVSPHELLQEISVRSTKKFNIGVQENPMIFTTWFFNTLSKDLGGSSSSSSGGGGGGGSKKKNTVKNIITDCFQGKIRVNIEKVVDKDISNSSKTPPAENQKIVKEIPFLYLSLDMPPQPLFKKEKDKTVIPQEPLPTLLSKFDGVTKQWDPSLKEWRSYKITKLPKYLILYIQRFTKNHIGDTEKNSTIVNFPLRCLDMSPYTDEKDVCTTYNLIANIRHNSNTQLSPYNANTKNKNDPTAGTYNLHVLQKSIEKWFDVQDLIVEETMPPLILLSEAYFQIYEREDIFGTTRDSTTTAPNQPDVVMKDVNDS
eukprot:TRINITY_DN959_c0_g1_i1.p1 TRINITY_DN959_c0_g1~~TRINITY_DN959_c0_g1_i1.p1  ORF type:complete len:407 (-),score=104.98 TRINITY_DN959_c0_g1_i1:47-1267(-)